MAADDDLRGGSTLERGLPVAEASCQARKTPSPSAELLCGLEVSAFSSVVSKSHLSSFLPRPVSFLISLSPGIRTLYKRREVEVNPLGEHR